LPSPRRDDLPRFPARLALRLAVCASLLLTSRSSAQEVSPILPALEEIDTGARLRVWAPPEEPREGTYLGVREGRLLLLDDAPRTEDGELRPAAAALSSIEAVWTPTRRTGTGALVGGLAGTAGGILFGLFVSEVSEGDLASGTSAIVGGLLGAVAGAGLGALVGSAFSGWKLRYEASGDGRGWEAPLPGAPAAGRAEPPPAGPEPWGRRTGWLVGQVGGSAWTGAETTAGDASGGAGALLGAAILAEFGAWRIGPEAQLAGIGADQSVVTYGGVVHLRLGGGRLQPYAIGGAGGQSWDSGGASPGQVDASLFALNGGLGARFPVGRSTAFGAELRAHHSVQRYDGPTPWLFTLAATVGLGL